MSGKRVLAYGAGQQSTALALMAAENKMAEDAGRPHPYPLVGIYDVALFCDLRCEPTWVYQQVEAVKKVYDGLGLRLEILEFDLFNDHAGRISSGKYIKMPLWTRDENGKKGKLRRGCTIDYKIVKMQQYVKYEMLGYRWRERLRPEDVGAHEMHIGFSAEEFQRIFDSKNPMFVNKFPLHDMGLTRRDNYRFSLERWGLDTRGSSCYICPFHKNFYFRYLQRHYPEDYQAVLEFDEVLEKKPETCPVRGELYLVPSLKRVRDLAPEECNDAQTFKYNGRRVWNGF